MALNTTTTRNASSQMFAQAEDDENNTGSPSVPPQPVFVDIPEIAHDIFYHEIDPDNKSELAKASSKLFNTRKVEGINGIAHDVLGIEREFKSTVTEEATRFVFYNFVIILMSTDRDAIESIIWGNPHLDMRTNKSIKAYFDQMRRKATFQQHPFIYMWQLVTPGGTSPTKAQTRELLDDMTDYARERNDCRDDAHWKEIVAKVRRIDFATKTIHQNKAWDGPADSAPLGNRRYLSEKAFSVRIFKLTWRKRLIEFVKVSKKRLDDDGHAEDQPLTPPLREVGYATSIDRLDDHRGHTSSNHLMNLAEACCRYRGFTDPAWRNFEMRDLIIYAIWQPSQASAAEVLMNRISGAYVYDAGGFSHDEAGKSMGSAPRIQDYQWVAMARTPPDAVEANMLREMQLFKEVADSTKEKTIQIREQTREKEHILVQADPNQQLSTVLERERLEDAKEVANYLNVLQGMVIFNKKIRNLNRHVATVVKELIIDREFGGDPDLETNVADYDKLAEGDNVTDWSQYDI